MNYFVDIAKKIAVFYVFSTFMMNLVNDEKYKKYIKMFSGLVLIILLIKPIGEIVRFDGNFGNLFDINTTGMMSDNLKENLKLASKRNAEILIADYKNVITEDIKNKLKEYEVNLVDIELEFELDSDNEKFGEVKCLYVYAKKTGYFSFEEGNGEDLVVIDLKKYLSSVYKINKDNIYVNIV